MKADRKMITVGLVGPCKAGKTLLKRGLTKYGYKVKHIAQEHSYVPDMWQKIAKPDILIFLEVSFEQTLLRSTLSWSKSEYRQQISRLNHAYTQSDLIINTSNLTPHQVLSIALKFLSELKSRT